MQAAHPFMSNTLAEVGVVCRAQAVVLWACTEERLDLVCDWRLSQSLFNVMHLHWRDAAIELREGRRVALADDEVVLIPLMGRQHRLVGVLQYSGRLPESGWRRDLLMEVMATLTASLENGPPTQVGGYVVTEFLHRDAAGGGRREKWFDAAQESDGTLRFAGILTALLQEPPLTLIGIEEPELTVHPGALPLLYDYLKQASARSRVLVTTHSPELLDLFDSDDVRVVERVDGVTRVAALDPAQRDAVRQRLVTLGELSRMEGLRAEPRSTQPEKEGALES